MFMDILTEHNVFRLPTTEEGKWILYLPFADYAAIFQQEEVEMLCRVMNGTHEGTVTNGIKLLLNKINDNHVAFYKAPESVLDMQSLMILPNNKCNFHCSYCYSAQGRTNQVIDPKKLKIGINYFLNKKRLKGKRLSITILGGGEPLLSWDLLRPALDEIFTLIESRGVSCPVSLVTNGSIYTKDVASYCVKHKISVSVSFDILKEVQNSQRGSWKIVSDNINRYADAGLDVAINTVISFNNVGLMKEMIKHLAEYNPKVKKVSFKTLMSSEYFRKVENRKNYYREFINGFFDAKSIADKLGIWLTCSYFNTCLSLTNRYCLGKFVITSEGDISICHTVGSSHDKNYSDFVFGHINEDKIDINNKKFKEIMSYNNNNKTSCKDCAAKWHCAGGCYADHFNLSEESQEAYCESMRLFLAKYLIYKYKL